MNKQSSNPYQQLCQKSSSSAKVSCPQASSYKSSESVVTKSYTVNFEPLLSNNFYRKTVAFIKEISSRVSPSSIKSAWDIGTQNDLSQPFLRSWKPKNYVSEFVTPAGTVYITADPIVMRAIFANSRKAQTGIFYDYENKRLFAQGILKDLYPEDIQKIGIENAVDMLVISAAVPHAALLRGPMIKALGSSAISAYSDVLIDIADGILKDLTEDEKKSCDVSQISFEYAVTDISKLFAGYETTRAGYQKLAKVLDAFSKKMTRIVSHRPTSIEEEKNIQRLYRR